jgi:uncharacterized membrane protein
VTHRFKVPAIVAAVAAYPFLDNALIHRGGSWLALLLFAALNVWRAVRAGKPLWRLAHGGLAAALVLGAVVADAMTTRLVPAFVHLWLAVLFGHTLRHPPTLIERMVRLQFPEFEPGIAEYLRQLTWVWTGFFAANVAICTGLALFAGEQLWTLYTGLVVYLLMALLAVGEYLYRPRRFPGLDIPPALDSLKVMLRDGHKVFRELRG